MKRITPYSDMGNMYVNIHIWMDSVAKNQDEMYIYI